MDVVCGTSSSSSAISSASGGSHGYQTTLNGSNSSSSCVDGESNQCGGGVGGDAASDKYVITNSCALFDFAVYTVVMGSLSSLGVVGNVVSFVVLLRDRGRSATSFLLQALAVADTMVLLAAVPLYVIPPIYPYTGHLAAYYAAYLSTMPVLWPVYFVPYTFTVLITVLVSMHRYCAVCKPTVARCGRIGASSSMAAGGRGGGRGRSSASIRLCPSTARQARRRVAVLAAFSVVYNIPRFFEYESVPVCGGGGGGNGNETRYAFEISAFGDNLVYRILYANVLYFVVIHGGPLLLIGFFNVKLIMALKRRQRRWAEMGKGWYQQDVSLVLVVVMCVFIVCQTPTFVDHILWTFVDESARTCGHWHYYYTAIGDVLVIFNSSVNFVIYILTSRNFRHGLVMQTLSAWANGVGGGGGGGVAGAAAAAANTGPGGTISAVGASRTCVGAGNGRRTTDCIRLSPRSAGGCGGVSASGAAAALLGNPATDGGGVRTSRDGDTAHRTTNCSIELFGIGASTATSNTLTVAAAMTTATAVGKAQLLQQQTTVRYFEPRVLFR